jgi:hypothetical protein
MLPAIAFFFIRNRHEAAKYKWYLLAWFILDCISIYVLANVFSHYLIQICLPLSFMAGLFFSIPLFEKKVLNRLQLKYLFIISLFYLFIEGFMHKQRFQKELDLELQPVTNYLEKHMDSGHTMYNFNFQQVLYFSLKKQSPTKYVHKSLMFNEKFIRILGIDQQQEMKKIFSQSIDFVVADITKSEMHLLKPYLADYEIVNLVNDKVAVYKKRSSSEPLMR